MFLLLVRHAGWTETLEYADWDSLVRDAADHEGGEYGNSGRVVGALELAFRGGDLANAITRSDLWDDIYAELRLNPQWRQAQANAERWSARND